ncbi:hypothetical protein SDC9_94930 [bioreactor metagenome]|uniref:Uncharacterized protein n=1 Tax=bioreactor metagenome TaxID=1076179 RepID=A0A645A5I3_9ZZZZ
MAIGGKARLQLVPHPLGGGIRSDLLRMLPLQLLQAPVFHVVVIVRHGGFVQHIIAVGVLVEFLPQPLHFLPIVHGSFPFPRPVLGLEREAVLPFSFR